MEPATEAGGPTEGAEAPVATVDCPDQCGLDPTEAAAGETSEVSETPIVEAPAPTPVFIPEVRDIRDLDWAAVHRAVDPAGVRERMASIVTAMEVLLDREGGPGLLFDEHREGAADRAIRVDTITDDPVWIVGDLHGDLLTLEAALTLVQAEQGAGPPRIVFLGDIFDDEGFGLETLLRLFELIVSWPRRICWVAGNHDEALSYDGARFASSVSPGDFADFLNANLAHEWIVRAGKLAVRLIAQAPRALFLPDGLLIAHAGFPLVDLHPALEASGDWNEPTCLSDFAWARAHPTARKKMPNRFTRGSQFGYEDFIAFCGLSARLGRPVTHMVRGHDHVEERYVIYPAYKANPILTTVALSRRLPRESFGPPDRVPTLARYVPRSLPQVHRLHIPVEVIEAVFPTADATEPAEPSP